MSSYKSKDTAEKYIQFLASPVGLIQQQVLAQAISAALPQKPQVILDAGCGTGWLIGKLKGSYPETRIFGCDSSPYLLAAADPSLATYIQHADLQTMLPYEPASFTHIIANMVLHDLADPSNAFRVMKATLTQTGSIIATIPNPYLSYPTGMWKRILGPLLPTLPKLRLLPKKYFTSRGSKTEWNTSIHSFAYSLNHYFQAAKNAGLYITRVQDVYSATDSTEFNLYHQLHRFPIILVVEFKKLGQ
jgi:SAM-dependent methyltransferase